jgi:hypothetical protein
MSIRTELFYGNYFQEKNHILIKNIMQCKYCWLLKKVLSILLNLVINNQ